jgi:hypothetical protein
MEIDRNQTLAGVPILRLRAFLRTVRHLRWPADFLERAFPGFAEEILDALFDEGYVETTSEPGIFKVSMKGEAFVRINAARPASRRARI